MAGRTAPPTAIESVLSETRLFRPPKAFASRARVPDLASYRKLYAASVRNPGAFWAKQAGALLWRGRWKKALTWDPPFAKWFVGGKLNASENCLDRHVATARRNKVAIRWEGEPGDQRNLTYEDLLRETCRFANVLRGLGVRAGDRVGIYLPMIPELPIAMLACARIGAVHSVVFGGFSAESLRDRMNDAQAKVLVTADGGWRRGKIVELKAAADAACAGATCVEKVLVVRRTGRDVPMTAGRDVAYEEAARGVPTRCEPEALDAEHPLYILYTSGTTGKPKGIVHTTAGYLLGATKTMEWVFDIRDEDVFWCTADIGWVTGHTYVVYGPLSVGATVVMYEGAPDAPEKDRFWDIVERHRVNIFYTAPTAIRTFVKWGKDYPARHDLSSLRLLGTVGEPINPEAWMWYHETIGGGRCPIVDTWWQTETGCILISPLPGATPTKPGSATLPLPGVVPEVVGDDGKPVPKGKGGRLVLRKPWPSMLRTIHGDPDRYVSQYWSSVPGSYFTGDGAHRDKDGYFWIMGRIDDVIKVAGHRLGTAEVESAIVSHPRVAESAVVARPDELTGSAIVAFVVLRGGGKGDNALEDEIKAHVARTIGPVARPAQVQFTELLPKTRSGKIMRRLLRDIASGAKQLGDMTTLEDVAVLERLRAEYGEE
ncbi:MAG: acetate--CoA ligase [Planctomycetales bacterium]|nr:acetate--CoA ligase [Planctomycetales bacterium]